MKFKKLLSILCVCIMLISSVSFGNTGSWDSIRFRGLSQGKYNISSGTGFFISNDYIVTNYHVVENCINYSARGAINPTAIDLVAYDKNLDLAVLKSRNHPKHLPAFKGNMESLLIGDKLYAMGYPLSHGETGVYNIVGLTVTSFNFRDAREMIELTLESIAHGNSGGPLMDANGRIVGMIQGKVTRYINNTVVDRKALAIRNEVIQAFLEKLSIPVNIFSSNEIYTGISPESVAKDFVVNIHCIRR